MINDDEDEMPALEDMQMAGTKEAPAAPNTGHVFLILDLPAHSTVGCDAKAIRTTATPATTTTAGEEDRRAPAAAGFSFQGIRDIPPGTHFVWVSEPNATMSRCGYWFVTAPERECQVRVKQWDKFNEVLVDPASQFESRHHRENIAKLYPHLLPYGFTGTGTKAQQQRGSQDEAELWERLTCCITENVLARVRGKTTTAAAAAAGHASATEWLFDTSDTAAGETSGVVGPAGAGAVAGPRTVYQNLVGSTGELHFLFPDGDVDLHEYIGRRDNTTTTTNNEQVDDAAAGPDTSLDILRLVDTPGTGVTGEDLVGELQLTFLTGLHLTNLSCVDQWWHLVLKVFLRAHKLLVWRPSLSLLFLRTLHAQVVYNEEYIAGGGDTPSSSSTKGTAATNTSAATTTVEQEIAAEVQHEYGGGTTFAGAANNNNNKDDAGLDKTSLLDMVPGNKKKLRAALTRYKRRMNELFLDAQKKTTLTPEQTAVGHVFAEMEAWFWRLGWDLRTDHVDQRRKARTWRTRDEGDGEDGDEDEDEDEEGDEYDEDDEYKPVIVNLDENGREIGMVSFH